MKNFIRSAVVIGLAIVGSAYAQIAQFNDNATYSTNGVSVGLIDAWSVNMGAGNVNFGTVIVTNTDTVVTITPLITNGVLRVKNVSTTNTLNYVAYGNNGTNYPNVVYPGEVARGRFTPDGSGKVHLITSNLLQTVQYLWLPN